VHDAVHEVRHGEAVPGLVLQVGEQGIVAGIAEVEDKRRGPAVIVGSAHGARRPSRGPATCSPRTSTPG